MITFSKYIIGGSQNGKIHIENRMIIQKQGWQNLMVLLELFTILRLTALPASPLHSSPPLATLTFDFISALFSDLKLWSIFLVTSINNDFLHQVTTWKTYVCQETRPVFRVPPVCPAVMVYRTGTSHIQGESGKLIMWTVTRIEQCLYRDVHVGSSIHSRNIVWTRSHQVCVNICCAILMRLIQDPFCITWLSVFLSITLFVLVHFSRWHLAFLEHT